MAAKIVSTHHQRVQEAPDLSKSYQSRITSTMLTDLLPVLKDIIRITCTVLSVDSCSFMLSVQGKEGSVQFFPYPVDNEEDDEPASRLLPVSALGENDRCALLNYQPFIIDDLTPLSENTPTTGGLYDWNLPTTGSLASFPLLYESYCIGSMTLLSSTPDYFSPECRRRCASLAEETAFTLFQRVQLLRVKTDLAQEKQAQVRLISLLAHELRSPLNTINGYLDLLLTGVGDTLNSEQTEFAQRARGGSEQLYSLLEDLLLLARADSGRLRLTREIITLPSLVENAVDDLALSATDHRIAMKVEVPHTLPRLYADAVRIQQVIRNLLSNAIRFTPDGGCVTVSASVEEREAERESIASDAKIEPGEGVQKIICLRIRDTGCGIAPEYQQRIFERFYQIKGADEWRSGGLGLGLTVARIIVEAHQGVIEVESEPGKGSTFVCRFPCLSN